VPSFVHQEFVQGAIDMIVAIGDRNRKGLDPRNHSEFCSFKATFETLSMFLTDYKKSVHEKDEELTPASTEVMDVEPDKKAIVARCTQSAGPKDVPRLTQPYIILVPRHSIRSRYHSPRIP
jgi:hypothetical protein